jgi:tetratricopeptide (TPR) repeat protein
MRRRIGWRILLGLGLLLIAGGALRFHARAGRADRLLHEGRDALGRGEWDRAWQCADRLEQGGDGPLGRLLRGESWLEIGRQELARGAGGDGERARLAFRRALAELTRIRGGAPADEVTVLAAECLLRLDQHRPAAVALKAVIRRNPDHKGAHRLLAAVYIDLNSPADAVAHLREWGRLDPAAGLPFRWIGFFHKSYNRPDEAAEAYREACQRTLEPGVRAEVVRELAETLLAGPGAYREALGVLAECPGPSARGAEVLALRGECHRGLGQTGEAKRLADQALQSAPHLPRALRLRAALHLDENQPDSARPLLEESLRQEPHDLATRHQLILACTQAGDAAAAARHRRLAEESRRYWDRVSRLHRAAQARPWDGAVRREIAELCLKIQRPAEALMWVRAALACDPDDPVAQHLLARLPAGEGPR